MRVQAVNRVIVVRRFFLRAIPAVRPLLGKSAARAPSEVRKERQRLARPAPPFASAPKKKRGACPPAAGALPYKARGDMSLWLGKPSMFQEQHEASTVALQMAFLLR